MIIYELVYKDGMTHSSFNYELIQEIWRQDKDLISHITKRSTNGNNHTKQRTTWIT